MSFKTRFPFADTGKKYKVMLLVALALLVWFAVSLASAPVLGLALRRCDEHERRNSVAVLRAKAQHPASQAA
ncbi:MAG: hypothetical protein JO265_13875 [Acidimicrobiia bacterium]|nr:hypothetical protein [Acidimicrobiia bacterium]